jgi:hypothetical protein
MNSSFILWVFIRVLFKVTQYSSRPPFLGYSEDSSQGPWSNFVTRQVLGGGAGTVVPPAAFKTILKLGYYHNTFKINVFSSAQYFTA